MILHTFTRGKNILQILCFSLGIRPFKNTNPGRFFSFVFLPQKQPVHRNLRLACIHDIPLTQQPLKGLIRILENILIIFHTVCLTPIPLYLTGSSIDQTDDYRKCKSTLVGTLHYFQTFQYEY